MRIDGRVWWMRFGVLGIESAGLEFLLTWTVRLEGWMDGCVYVRMQIGDRGAATLLRDCKSESIAS